MLKKNAERRKIYLVLGMIFLLTLLLNILTPIIADDFGYSLNLDKEHLRGLKDIINFQIVHYNYWGGRSVAHTLVQLFLYLPKWIFNVLNSLCYTILIYLIYKIAKQDRNDNYYLLGIIFFALYFLTPVFGQNILWLTGSCNYLWTTTIILFLINLYLTNRNDSPIYRIFIFFLGLISGWTNENSAVGLIVILSLLTFLEIKDNKKIKVWKISGLIGSAFGFIIMIAAPGNYIRSSGYSEDISLIYKLFQRFLACTVGIFKYLLPLIVCLGVILIIFKFQKRKINRNLYIFLIGSIFTIYSMVMSPTFPERAWFSIIVFLLIATMTLVFNLEIKARASKYLKFLTIIIVLLFIVDYQKLIIDINSLNKTWSYRIEYINEHKSDKEIVLSSYKTTNRKNPLYGQIDITNNPKEWPNTDMEKYFKVESIAAK